MLRLVCVTTLFADMPGSWPPTPCQSACPHCKANTTTVIKRRIGTLTWLGFGVCFIMGSAQRHHRRTVINLIENTQRWSVISNKNMLFTLQLLAWLLLYTVLCEVDEGRRSHVRQLWTGARAQRRSQLINQSVL